MKKHQIFLIALFIVPIFVLSVLSICLPKKTESVEEKRTFHLPEFSLEALASGEYTKGLENYYSDTFPFRDFFINADNAVRTAFTLSGADGDMIYHTGSSGELGSGENLFGEAEATPEPTPTIDPNAPPPPAPIVIDDLVEDKGAVIMANGRAMEVFYRSAQAEAAYGGLIKKLSEKVPGTNVYSMVVPTAIEFYSPEKYHTMTQSQKDSIDNIYANIGDTAKAVDAYGWLASVADQYIYFRSDHHWTARGAHAAYTAFAKQAGFEPVALESLQTASIPGFLGTLYSSTKSAVLRDNPDEVEVFYPLYPYTCTSYRSADMSVQGTDVKAVYLQLDNTSNKYLSFFGGDHPMLHAVTENKNGRKILMTKDSFGNALGVFLLNNYEEVYIVDPRQVTFDLPTFIAEHGIDDVLIQNYAFAISNSAIINGLNNMIGQ